MTTSERGKEKRLVQKGENELLQYTEEEEGHKGETDVAGVRTQEEPGSSAVQSHSQELRCLSHLSISNEPLPLIPNLDSKD